MSNDIPDRIERSIEIAAPLDRVWAIVSVPGWWINDGAIVEHRIDRDEAEPDIVVVHDEDAGRFRVRVVELDEPHHAAFRWLGGYTDDHATPGDEGTSLVEFSLTSSGPTVTVRVVESGFADLPVSDERKRAAVDDNTDGWIEELAALRDTVEA